MNEDLFEAMEKKEAQASQEALLTEQQKLHELENYERQARNQEWEQNQEAKRQFSQEQSRRIQTEFQEAKLRQSTIAPELNKTATTSDSGFLKQRSSVGNPNDTLGKQNTLAAGATNVPGRKDPFQRNPANKTSKDPGKLASQVGDKASEKLGGEDTAAGRQAKKLGSKVEDGINVAKVFSGNVSGLIPLTKKYGKYLLIPLFIIILIIVFSLSGSKAELGDGPKALAIASSGSSGTVNTVDTLDGLKIPFPETAIGLEAPLCDQNITGTRIDPKRIDRQCEGGPGNTTFGETRVNVPREGNKPASTNIGAQRFGPSSPEQAMWYMNEPWPSPDSKYAHKKVVITSKASGKAVVASIEEKGPQQPSPCPSSNRCAGGSPDVLLALGWGDTNDKRNIVTIAFAADQNVPLGPVKLTSNFSLCIDPGHPSEPPGENPDEHLTAEKGTNGGAEGSNGISELFVAWDVSQRLEKLLTESGISSVNTKNSRGQYMNNKQRAEICNKAGASYMLRLHLDATGTSKSGYEFYTPQTPAGWHPTKSWGKKSCPSPTVATGSGSSTKIFRRGFASSLNGLLKDNGIEDDSATALGKANGGVLTGSCFSEVPTGLIEIANLDNKKDLKWISDPENRQIVAKALAAGALALAPIQAPATSSTQTTGETALPLKTSLSFKNDRHDCSVSKPSGCNDPGHRTIIGSQSSVGATGIPSNTVGEASDIITSANAPALAPFSGKVTASRLVDRSNTKLGYFVAIQSTDSRMVAGLFHLNDSGRPVQGDTVKAGQQVGTILPLPCAVYNCPHLHFELWIDGKVVNAGLGANMEQVWNAQKKALGL